MKLITSKTITTNFKNCLRFYKAGWKVKEYAATQTESIIVKMENNQQVQDFTLNLTEQQLWLKVLEQRGKK
jgi:phage regulator Rha-like protein